ncbi:MAG: GntR family transcriptional regulator [Candidatus Velthaea sp.]
MEALELPRLNADARFGPRAYDALRAAIVDINIYEAGEDELRLDERALAEQLGVSRTPIREALARLEHDGLIASVPRRGYFIVKKSKRELLEIITVWAALESMAARLLTQRASDGDIASLRAIFSTFDGTRVAAHMDEYSEQNLRFHKRIIELSACDTLIRTAESMLIHVRAIRHRTIGENRRFERSIVDHLQIIDAIEARDADNAERLVRDHALNLAAHVARNDADL